MMINMFPTYHENGIISSHGLTIVQQHVPRDPSIDKLLCYRRLIHGIDLSCVLYKIYAHCYDAILYYMGTIMGTNAILYCTGTIDMGTIGINLYRHSDSPNVLCDRFKA